MHLILLELMKSTVLQSPAPISAEVEVVDMKLESEIVGLKSEMGKRDDDEH
ncbi:hypothetical protein R6Q57_013363, partial [Mikania cordata]